MHTDYSLKNSLGAELYGIGTGPGAPGLLTIAAAHILSNVNIIFTPAPKTANDSLAGEIANAAGIPKEKMCVLSFPMETDTALLHGAWEKSARIVCETLDKGKKAAFLTLGDPGIFSTWTYLRREVTRIRPATSIETIPGVAAMNATAAVLNLSLVEGLESLCLLPLPDPVSKLREYYRLMDTIVIYKIGSRLTELAQWLTANELLDAAWFAAGIGLPREIYGPLRSINTKENGYLSVVILKKGGLL